MQQRVFAACAQENMAVDTRQILSLKPVFAFQTLRLAMLGKWATIHEKVFFWARTALRLCYLARTDFKRR